MEKARQPLDQSFPDDDLVDDFSNFVEDGDGVFIVGAGPRSSVQEADSHEVSLEFLLREFFPRPARLVAWFGGLWRSHQGRAGGG